MLPKDRRKKRTRTRLIAGRGFIAHSEKVSELAATVDDNGGCVFVTAFSGLFAPYWIDDAKGTIFVSVCAELLSQSLF